MDKLLKILHKKLDNNTSKILKDKVKEMDVLLKEEKIIYKKDTPFSFYEKEWICNGIENKRKIEKAYFDGYFKMQDYFDTLDYNEKKRLMNYEINEVLKQLVHFNYDDQKIYIPFFDKQMNAIYENDMVLFQLKQYRRITYDYEDLFHLDIYNKYIYDSTFSSLKSVYHKDDMYSYYSLLENRLYFLKGNEYMDFITIKDVSIEKMYQISDMYFNRDMLHFIELLFDTEIIDEKINKKLLKMEKKMR